MTPPSPGLIGVSARGSIKHPARMSAQVHLRAQLELAANLNQWNGSIFLINFGSNLRTLKFLGKIYLLDTFCSFLSLFLISAQSKQAPAQKILFLNNCPRRLICRLRILTGKNHLQKQSLRGVLQKKNSQKFRKIHRKTQVFSCEFCEISKNSFS